MPSIKTLMLLGGEPFLHPQLIELCKIAREIFPDILLNILIKTLGFSWKDKHNKDYISAKDFINYYILFIER